MWAPAWEADFAQRFLLQARLNASSRWLDVQSPEQFEESVYQEGLTMLVQAVSEVASLVRSAH